jgi:hypothetical protein
MDHPGEFKSTAASPEPIVKTGSSADITSFDDLERVHSAPMDPRPVEAGKTEKVDAAVKAGPEKKVGKEDANAKETKEKEGKEVLKEAKILKVRSGDKDVDLRSDSVIEVTVDGKPEKVTLEDLRNEYSGKINHRRKFQELDTERKAFHSERQELQSGIDKIVKLSKESPESAVEYLCDILGEEPRVFMNRLREQFQVQIDEYAKLSPEERAQKELQEERDYYKNRADSQKADRAREVEQQSLKARVQATQKQFEMDDETYLKVYDLMGKSGKKDVEPEQVGEYYAEMTREIDTKEILKGVDPEMEPEALKAAIQELKEEWELHPKLTKKQVEFIAKEMFGPKTAKKLAAKVKKAPPVETSTNFQSSDEVWNFSQL